MPTISLYVKNIVDEQPLLQETISQGIVNFANLAEKIAPKIEKLYKKKVNAQAIVMALRRYSEEIQHKEKKLHHFDYRSEIIMKTNLCDIGIVKSPALFAELRKLYDMVDYEKGDTLNVIHGNYEVSIITNDKHMQKLLQIMKNEKILNIEKNLVSIGLRYDLEFMKTPGVIATVVKKFSWENINIFELVTTLTEMTFIISKDDSLRALAALQEIVGKN